jgi:hypothetical protein
VVVLGATTAAAQPMAGPPPRVTVVELPRAGVQLGAPTRPHHALSFASETPRRMLRTIGLDATDCATRVRMPTRFRSTREGLQADLQAQVLLACRF